MTWSLWAVREGSYKKQGMNRVIVSLIDLAVAPSKERSYAVLLNDCHMSSVVQKYFWTFWKLLLRWLSMFTGP